MSLSLFGFTFGATEADLPEIFPFPYAEGDFVTTEVESIYSKILTDVLERTDGVPQDHLNLLWDNCLASENQDGLVSMLAKAMTDKKDLFLVFDPGLNIIREAKNEERTKIQEEYKKKGEAQVNSRTGVFVTFKKYKRTDMLKIYASLEYCTVASLSKSMNLSKAVQLKYKNLRSGVSLADSADVKAQAVKHANALKDGKDIFLDAEDVIETAKPDLTATQSAEDHVNKKLSKYLGLPASYLTGESSKGLGDSGMGDTRAVERGLKGYYFSVIKPVIEKIFDVKTTFKSDDFDQIKGSLEVLKTMEVTSDEYLSKESKQGIVNKCFGLPSDAKGDEPDPNAGSSEPSTKGVGGPFNDKNKPPPGGQQPKGV